MLSWENDILGTLLRHKAGSLHDTIIVLLSLAMLLALGRTLGHQLCGIHLRLVHLGTGESHSCTLNTDRPLDDFKSRAHTHKSLHKPKVTAWNWIGGP